MAQIENRVVSISHPGVPVGWRLVAEKLLARIPGDQVPIRLALIQSDGQELVWEVTTVTEAARLPQPWGPLWRLVERRGQSRGRFVAVHVVPTGIRAAIGGFAGDATPATNLLASVCDALVTHPNTVTASDIYCASDNVLYVEGNILSRFLLGQLELVPRRARRIGLLVDRPLGDDYLENVLNAIHAMRTVGGLFIDPVWISERSLRANVHYGVSGRALGTIEALDSILDAVRRAEGICDALAITSEIAVSPALRYDYYAGKPIANPWGGVEAILTHAVTTFSRMPAAHAPMLTNWATTRVEGPVDPRDAAEVISTSFLCSVLRGLRASPRPVAAGTERSGEDRISIDDVAAIELPAGAMGGIPALAALDQAMPIIAVEENRTLSPITLSDLGVEEQPPRVYPVANYVEAAGTLALLREGLSWDAVRRPISRTVPRFLQSCPTFSKESVNAPQS